MQPACPARPRLPGPQPTPIAAPHPVRRARAHQPFATRVAEAPARAWRAVTEAARFRGLIARSQTAFDSGQDSQPPQVVDWARARQRFAPRFARAVRLIVSSD